MPVPTFGPNEAFCVPETSEDDAVPALLARTIPPEEAFPDVPPPEPPATASAMPARTTGNAATRTGLRCRPSRTTPAGITFRGIRYLPVRRCFVRIGPRYFTGPIGIPLPARRPSKP